MHEIATWPDAEFPFQIDYARDTFEKLRESALQGLLDLPKGGLGIGGVLLGKHEGNRIMILDSFEILCSHARGPSFALTSEEQVQARALIAKSGAASGATRVIGWYSSKGLKPLELTDSDRTMLAALFSGGWQIGLLLQPNALRPARIRFFASGPSGELVEGQPGDLPRWYEEPATPVFQPVVVSPPKEELPVADPPVADQIVTSTRDVAPLFQWANPPGRKTRKWKWLSWAAAAALASAGVAGAARTLLERDRTPSVVPPPLALSSTGASAQTSKAIP